MKRIENVLDEMDIKYEIKDNTAFIEFWTDKAGPDIPIKLDYDGTPEDLVEKFTEYAESYDVDDEVELFVTMWGFPERIRVIIDDCQEAKDTLMEIAEKMKAALRGEDVKDYYVTYKIDARYEVKVSAKSLKDAKKEAACKFSDADFGDAEDIDGEIIGVTNEDGDDLYEDEDGDDSYEA